MKNKTDELVFESTGLTEYFDEMLLNLQSDFKVITINVDCDPDICLRRVHSRDQSIHIDVSDEEVNEINSARMSEKPDTDFQIFNSEETVDELKTQIKEIIKFTADTK